MVQLARHLGPRRWAQTLWRSSSPSVPTLVVATGHIYMDDGDSVQVGTDCPPLQYRSLADNADDLSDVWCIVYVGKHLGDLYT